MVVGRDPKVTPRNKYIRANGQRHILAYSSKTASTTIQEMYRKKGRQYLTQDEVAKERLEGRPVHLYMRDPIDRMVSAYRYFTAGHPKRRRQWIQHHYPEDHEALTRVNTPFDSWAITALRHWDEHWTPVTEYHTYEGVFLPTRVIDVAFLGGEKLNQTEPSPVYIPHYLEDELEDYYNDDLRLWRKVRNRPNGVLIND